MAKTGGRKDNGGFFGKVSHAVLRTLAGFNAMSVALMLIAASCQWLSPDVLAFSGLVCMFFPILVAVNICFLPFWLLFRPRYMLITFLGLVFCAGSLYSYCPVLTGQKEPTSDGLKVLSFNTYGWGREHGTVDGVNPTVQFCLEQQPDVMFLQEMPNMGKYNELLENDGYTIIRPQQRGNHSVVTRLPVVDTLDLSLPTQHCNGAIAARLLWNGDTITVVSVHLESYHLLDDDREAYVNVVENPTGDGTKTRAKSLMNKMLPCLKFHGVQADVLAEFVEREMEAGRHVILGGDFNDVPNSYAAATMRSLLTDCFRKSGRGVGYTFNESMMYVRIDHIFCSETLKPVKTWVDKTTIYSDHYPILTVLER